MSATSLGLAGKVRSLFVSPAEFTEWSSEKSFHSLSWKELQATVPSKRKLQTLLKSSSDKNHEYSERPGRLPTTRQPEDDSKDGYGSRIFQDRKQQILQEAACGDVVYLPEEEQTWQQAWATMTEENSKHGWAAQSFGMRKLDEDMGVSQKIPQIQDFGRSELSFEPVAVCGYINPRIFIAALGHRLMPCSPYVRPASSTNFSKEPDYFHEVVGHLCSLLDANFADLLFHIGSAAYFPSNMFEVCTCNMREFRATNGWYISRLRLEFRDQMIQMKQSSPVELLCS